MKKMVLCLAILSLLAVPAMAMEYAEGIDVQAYGTMTANYQAGCVDQKTDFIGFKCIDSVDKVCKTTNFDCHANVPNTSCGLNLSQNKYESNYTTTNQFGGFCEKVDAKFAVGSNDMTSGAGVAICATPAYCGPTGSASVVQTQSLNQTSQASQVGSCYTPACNAYTNYSACQTVNVRAGN